jgi:hypothetical protein
VEKTLRKRREEEGERRAELIEGPGCVEMTGGRKGEREREKTNQSSSDMKSGGEKRR